MKQFARAGGIAAALIALVAAAGYADPSQASEAEAVSGMPSYLEHAGASNEEMAEGDVEKLATSFIDAAEAAIPRARALDELVSAFEGTETQDAEQDCLANAVYFEARGEPIEGQLAVADVVMNRVGSGKYPTTICGVVTQPWQFSFVRDGIIPAADRTSASWKKAVAISEIVLRDLDTNMDKDVLWYHADYVSPGWGKRLKKQRKIGLHIFYS